MTTRWPSAALVTGSASRPSVITRALRRIAVSAGALMCRLGRHDLRVIRRISGSTQHFGCVRCKGEWGINHDAMTVLPWSDVAGFYEDTGIYTPDPAEVAKRLDPENWTRKVST